MGILWVIADNHGYCGGGGASASRRGSLRRYVARRVAQDRCAIGTDALQGFPHRRKRAESAELEAMESEN